MKPTSIGLLCLACCLASVAAAYFVFETLHEPAPIVASRPTESLPDDRVGDLELQVASLKAEIDRLRNDQPTVIYAPAETTGAAAPAGTPATAPAATPVARNLDELAKRVADIESGETAARTLRERAILELNGDDRRARGMASNLLAELAKAGDAKARQALIDAAKSEDAGIRDEAVEAMGRTGMVEFLPALIEAAKDEHAGVRDEAAEALRRLPPDKAGPVLVEMLGDTDSRVLREAIDAIGDIGYAEGAGALRDMTTHQDENIAIEAALALKRLGDPSGAESWVPTFGMRMNSTDVAERRRAVQSLRRLRMESARPYLQQALNDADARVRRDAQRALNELDAD